MTDRPDTIDADIRQPPAPIALDGRRLTAAEFHGLAAVPPEFEWFENLKNPGTKRIYKNAIRDFMRFTGITRPEEFRLVTRAHVIAWRDDLERRLIGAPPIKDNRPAARSATAWRRCHRCSNISATATRFLTIRSKASSVRRRRAAQARHRRSAIIRPASFSRRHEGKPQSQARPRDPVDAALPRAAARGTLQAKGRIFDTRTRRAASQDRRQG